MWAPALWSRRGAGTRHGAGAGTDCLQGRAARDSWRHQVSLGETSQGLSLGEQEPRASLGQLLMAALWTRLLLTTGRRCQPSPSPMQ